MELWKLTAEELRQGFQRREVSPLEVVNALLARIQRLDSQLGAFRQVLAESARQEAFRLTEELAGGRSRGPLHGIPVAVKELIDVEGAVGCYGSEVFGARISERDAEAVRRLRAAGAVIIGVTRSHEFGWGITTQHSRLGNTSNPWNTDRVPGGSSGGSAAALAAGMVPLALGTDTGGSVRIPAAFCGVAGLKPTFGTISTRGVVPLAPSLDHVGPMARTTGDLAMVLKALAGFDSEDPATKNRQLPDLSLVAGDRLEGIRVGTAPALHLTPMAPDYSQIFTRTLTRAAEAGAEIVEVDIPHPDRIRPAFVTLQMAEAYHAHSVTLGTFPTRSADYGSDVRGRLEEAARVGISEYLEAHTEAQRIRRRFEQVFELVDVVLTPVSAGPPSMKADPDHTMHLGRTIPFRDLVMDYTVPQDIAGLPACVFPVGFDTLNLPVGVQATARARREDLALRVASVLQQPPQNSARWPHVKGLVSQLGGLVQSVSAPNHDDTAGTPNTGPVGRQ